MSAKKVVPLRNNHYTMYGPYGYHHYVEDENVERKIHAMCIQTKGDSLFSLLQESLGDMKILVVSTTKVFCFKVSCSKVNL